MAKKTPTTDLKSPELHPRVQVIRQMKDELQTLTELRELTQQRINALEAEQRTDIVAARVKKDSAAQLRIDERSEQIAALRRDDLLNYGALTVLSQNLEQEENQLRRDELRSDCAYVKGLIDSHLRSGREQRILDLVEELRKGLTEMVAAEDEIRNAVLALDPSLHPLVANLYSFASRRAWFVAYQLKDVLGIPVRDPMGYTPAQVAQCLSDLLEQVDELSRHDVAV